MSIIKTSKTKLILKFILCILVFYSNTLIFFYLFDNYITYSIIPSVISLPIAMIIAYYLEEIINYKDLNVVDYEHYIHNQTIDKDT